jgi:hypothetical protein
MGTLMYQMQVLGTQKLITRQETMFLRHRWTWILLSEENDLSDAAYDFLGVPKRKFGECEECSNAYSFSTGSFHLATH